MMPLPPRRDDAHARHRQHWRQELDSAALFAGLAAIERNARRGRSYRRLAEVETRHAERFAAELARAGVDLPPFRPSARTRWLLALARRFGTAAVLPRIARLEQGDARSYRLDEEAWFPAEEEQANAVWLAEFAGHEASEAAKRLLLRFRRAVIALVGGTLFLVSLLLMRNAQLEGLWFGLLTGVAVGPVVHYALGKLIVPLGLGRVWCGWACWTAALLDQLPYRKSAGWLPGPAHRWRLAHLGASLLLRVTSRPALVKVAGDAAACQACASRACTSQCPMDIRIPDYIGAGTRLLSTECIACQQCVAVCPPNTLGLSVGFDLGGLDLLEERPARPPRRAPTPSPGPG